MLQPSPSLPKHLTTSSGTRIVQTVAGKRREIKYANHLVLTSCT